MTCGDARSMILEAGRSELEGRGDSPLARHLRECHGCASLARAVLEEEEQLGRELVAAVPAPDLDGLLEQALPTRGGRTGVLPFRRRFMGWALLPLAAAATLVGVFMGGEPPLPGDPGPPTSETPGLAVEAPEGQNVVVLATGNPDITVLWLF